MEAIILAGGIGSRLDGYKDGNPKPMVDVGGKPFLEILLSKLESFGYSSICLAVGHKSEIIISYFGNKYGKLDIAYSVEKELLGTGGAIKQALTHVSSEIVTVINGDTLVDIDLTELNQFHLEKNAAMTVTAYALSNYDRYGTVVFDEDSKRITQFKEKSFTSQGSINAGVYVINRDIFDEFNLPEKFSFESDFMEKEYELIKEYAFLTQGYFIDIGIPDDLEKIRKDRATS